MTRSVRHEMRTGSKSIPIGKRTEGTHHQRVRSVARTRTSIISSPHPSASCSCARDSPARSQRSENAHVNRYLSAPERVFSCARDWRGPGGEGRPGTRAFKRGFGARAEPRKARREFCGAGIPGSRNSQRAPPKTIHFLEKLFRSFSRIEETTFSCYAFTSITI